MKKIAFFLLGMLLSAMAFADTGTYEILSYTVKATPLSDGLVDMEYYQKWEVTGGHIPWITVGTANTNFEITGKGGAVKEIGQADGFTGVRIDLDKDYQSGDVFEVSFTLRQGNLLWAEDTLTYKMEFTPGWYDNAFINYLGITVRFFAPIDSVKPDPEPTSIAEETMTWEWKDLNKGEQVTISFTIPSHYYPDIKEDNLKSKGKSAGTIALIVIIVIIALILLIAFLAEIDGGDYSGGGIFVGSSGGSGGGIFSGGGGGAGGRGGGCACACVSCACACACAGGGGAGCSRKLDHECDHCKPKNHENSPISFIARLLSVLHLWKS